MGVNVSYDFSEYRAFFDKMRAAKSGFQKELENWMDAVGVEFLNEVSQQIRERSVMVTSNLLHSFERNGEGNVWEADYGAMRLSLEVGTSLEYALWANNGHRQKPGRFVPGYWKTVVVNGVEKDTFEYDPKAKSGMVLKAEWVQGKHYFDAAIKVFAPQFEKSFERKLEQWLEQYFEL